jgi:hypothetical protein
LGIGTNLDGRILRAMSRTRITPDEARRALYIDFEGRKGAPPVLLGCTRRSRLRTSDSVWQAVTEPRLTPFAVADHIESLALGEAVERILVRAEKRDRLIVAWSEHELDVVREYCPELLERFEARFRNARDLAERWRNKCHDGVKPPSGALADYLSLTGYEVPEHAGPGRVGDTIRILLDALGRGRRVSDITDKQLRRWDDLRDHNRHDCAGMRSVTILAAEEIDAKDRRGRREAEESLTRVPRAKSRLRIA